MNKKFGNKYYTLITDEYIEKKSLFKTSIVNYSNIKKIYMEVPMYDNFERNLNCKYHYNFKILDNNGKKIYFSLNTTRDEFIEITNFLSSLNIVIQTNYYDETRPNAAD